MIKEKYEVLHWQHGTKINKDCIEIIIQTEEHKEVNISVEYDAFVLFLEETFENFKNYIRKHKHQNNLDELFNDFEEIGVDMFDYIQQYVDKRINKEAISVVTDEFDELKELDELGESDDE